MTVQTQFYFWFVKGKLRNVTNSKCLIIYYLRLRNVFFIQSSVRPHYWLVWFQFIAVLFAPYFPDQKKRFGAYSFVLSCWSLGEHALPRISCINIIIISYYEPILNSVCSQGQEHFVTVKHTEASGEGTTSFLRTRYQSPFPVLYAPEVVRELQDQISTLEREKKELHREMEAKESSLNKTLKAVKKKRDDLRMQNKTLSAESNQKSGTIDRLYKAIEVLCETNSKAHIAISAASETESRLRAELEHCRTRYNIVQQERDNLVQQLVSKESVPPHPVESPEEQNQQHTSEQMQVSNAKNTRTLSLLMPLKPHSEVPCS